MIKAFPIDFVRQILEQTLLEEHLKNTNFFGGQSQVNLLSFYEQLQKEDEVNRFVETYRDLSEQQNRTGLIMNGTIIAPENPTITNLNQCTIIPMSFTCSFRVKLEDRDNAIYTINNLIKVLKGRKRDVAEFVSGKLFMVQTIGNVYEQGASSLTAQEGSYLGTYYEDVDINTDMENLIAVLLSKGVYVNPDYYYYLTQYDGLSMIVVKKEDGEWKIIQDDGTYTNVIFPPANETFEKYSVSLSFDSIRCDEPRVLNSDEYCTISFGGSATIVNEGIRMGNDLVKLFIEKSTIKGNPDVTLQSNGYWLEPLEIPSGNSASNTVNQLLSNKFLAKSHNNSLSLSIQYTFIADMNIPLIKQMFLYGRYGTLGTSTNNYRDGITPNMIFKIKETWSSWGNVEIITFYAKIVESVDIDNTESDTLTITVPFQIQGE